MPDFSNSHWEIKVEWLDHGEVAFKVSNLWELALRNTRLTNRLIGSELNQN